MDWGHLQLYGEGHTIVDIDVLTQGRCIPYMNKVLCIAQKLQIKLVDRCKGRQTNTQNLEQFTLQTFVAQNMGIKNC